jgi:hypothetical protein
VLGTEQEQSLPIEEITLVITILNVPSNQGSPLISLINGIFFKKKKV